MSDHALNVLSVCFGGATLLVAIVGVVLAYLGLKYAADQLRLLRQEQRARVAAEAEPLTVPGQGTILVGGMTARLIRNASHRLYGGGRLF